MTRSQFAIGLMLFATVLSTPALAQVSEKDEEEFSEEQLAEVAKEREKLLLWYLTQIPEDKRSEYEANERKRNADKEYLKSLLRFRLEDARRKKRLQELYEDPEGFKIRRELSEILDRDYTCFNPDDWSIMLPRDGLTLEQRGKKFKFGVKNLKTFKQKRFFFLSVDEVLTERPPSARIRELYEAAPFRDQEMWDNMWNAVDIQHVRGLVFSVDEAHRYLAGIAKYLLDIPDEVYEGDFRLELDQVEWHEVDDGELPSGESDIKDGFILDFRLVNIDRSAAKDEDRATEDSPEKVSQKPTPGDQTQGVSRPK